MHTRTGHAHSGALEASAQTHVLRNHSYKNSENLQFCFKNLS